jgi:hypothetical protein
MKFNVYRLPLHCDIREMLGCRESQGLQRIMNRPVHLQQCCSAFHLELDIARRKRDFSFGPRAYYQHRR